MQCPKCEHEQADRSEICSACGLVFAKYWKYHPRPDETGQGRPEDNSARIEIVPDPALRTLLLPDQHLASQGLLVVRAALWLFLLLYGCRLIFAGFESNAAGESFLHLINLPFHEGGHVIFGILGQFIGSLGGTLMQLIMPAACCYVFLFRQRDVFAASVALWWLGENFLDIAPYIHDASRGVLPLLGGNTGQHAPYGFHDWQYLLTETGLIAVDTAIAWSSHLFGSLLMMLAMAWGGLILLRQWRST